MKKGPFRGGAIHVLAERCSTCVFRPGNKMMLEPGRLGDLVKRNKEKDTALICHQTLPYNHQYDAEPAVCRGYFDAYARDVTPLRMAIAMNLIIEDPTPIERKAQP